MINAQFNMGRFSMKGLQVLPLVLGLIFASAGVANAQTGGVKAETAPTRAQVKMERDEFLKTHRWDIVNDNWVMRPDFEAPAGVKSRTEIKAERDDFLRNNRWDVNSETWMSLKGQPRDLGKMSREQVRAETRAFLRTHEWRGEEGSGAWIEVKPRKK